MRARANPEMFGWPDRRPPPPTPRQKKKNCTGVTRAGFRDSLSHMVLYLGSHYSLRTFLVQTINEVSALTDARRNIFGIPPRAKYSPNTKQALHPCHENLTRVPRTTKRSNSSSNSLCICHLAFFFDLLPDFPHILLLHYQTTNQWSDNNPSQKMPIQI